jgi:hypothetical protein
VRRPECDRSWKNPLRIQRMQARPICRDRFFVEIYNGPLNGSAGVRDLATDSLTVSQPLAPFWLRGEKEPASGPS